MPNFHFQNEDVDKKIGKFEVLTRDKEEAMKKGYGIEPNLLCLSSDKGFLNRSVFRYIVIRLAKWWRVCQCLVYCFMICNNMTIHKCKDIRAFAKSMRMHLVEIIPVTSHWFQIHDQQPFGALKKKMTQGKIHVWTSTAGALQNNVDLLNPLLDHIEMHAFEAVYCVKRLLT